MGNPFVHMELSTGDINAAKKFYKKVFDWKLNQSFGSDMGNYTLINTGSKNVGGGITEKMMPGQPTAWTVYAEVDSVKKTIAKAEKAGAKVMMPYQEIPEHGRDRRLCRPDRRGLRRLGTRQKTAKPAKKAGRQESTREEEVSSLAFQRKKPAHRCAGFFCRMARRTRMRARRGINPCRSRPCLRPFHPCRPSLPCRPVHPCRRRHHRRLRPSRPSACRRSRLRS